MGEWTAQDTEPIEPTLASDLAEAQRRRAARNEQGADLDLLETQAWRAQWVTRTCAFLTLMSRGRTRLEQCLEQLREEDVRRGIEYAFRESQDGTMSERTFFKRLIDGMENRCSELGERIADGAFVSEAQRAARASHMDGATGLFGVAVYMEEVAREQLGLIGYDESNGGTLRLTAGRAP